jgi:hypothetical protein
MEITLTREVNSDNNIAFVIEAHYTAEEFDALAKTKGLALPAIPHIRAELGLWRDPVKRHNPTFDELYNPGIRISGFTPLYADIFERDFEDEIGKYIRRALAPILEAYRAVQHKRLEMERDAHFGADRQLGNTVGRRFIDK